MKFRSSIPPRSRVATAITVAALGVTMLSPLTSPALARTHDVPTVTRLDLAVALPTSSSLADAGFADYGWLSMDAPVADDFFVDLGDDPAYTRDAQATGYVAGYSTMWQPMATMGTPAEDDASTFIIGSVYQFESEEGASDAIALVNDGDASTMPADYEDHEIDLGDESSYSSFSFDGSGDVPIHSILIREGELVGEISVFYGSDFTDPAEQEDAALALAEMVDDGLQTTLSGETPNLSQLAPVYDDGGLLDFDGYLYHDGALTERYPGESEATAQGREQSYIDSNATAVYRVIQPIIADSPAGSKNIPHYGVSTTIASFASERDAKAWLKGRPEVLRAADGVIEVEEIDLDADMLPDGINASDVSVFTYTQDFGDDEPYYKIQINVRVGNIGFTTYLESAVATPSEDALIAAASDILTAIDEGGVPAIMHVPAATQDDADTLADPQP